jgi:MoaA/NifB/PqqE/SkfB family radical SAM enzyme
MGVSFHGQSMRPCLEDEDELTVQPVAWEALRPGDIITCRLDDKFPTMRIVRKLAGKVVLRGDGWPESDFEAWPDDVLGRVVARRRGEEVLSRDTWRWKAQALRALADDRVRRMKRRAVAATRWFARGVARRTARWVLGRDAPAMFQVNIAASCNLACRMCPYLPVHDDPGYVREMTEETFRQLLPAIATAERLHLSGSGEPLMNRQIMQFLDLARQANRGLEIALTTNGTILTEAILRGLIERRLSRLTVSLDGLTHETVSAIRTGINTAKVLAHLELLQRLKREMRSELPLLRINYMIGYGSYAELPAFIRRARSLGVKEVHLLEVLTGDEESLRQNLRQSLDRDGGAGLRLAKRLAAAAGITLILPVTAHDACFHPYTPHIAENGDVSPCCYMDYEGRTFSLDGREVRMPKMVFGNVNQGGLEAVWRSPEYRQLRERDAVGDLPAPCQTCMRARVPTSIRVQEVMG